MSDERVYPMPYGIRPPDEEPHHHRRIRVVADVSVPRSERYRKTKEKQGQCQVKTEREYRASSAGAYCETVLQFRSACAILRCRKSEYLHRKSAISRID